MTKRDRELLAQFTAVPHARHGNTRAWSVTGPTMFRGQIVTLHAMCSGVAAIRAAMKQDAVERENAAECGRISPLEILDSAELHVRHSCKSSEALNRALDIFDIARGEVACA